MSRFGYFYSKIQRTSDSIGGSPPASSNKTLQFGFSDKRDATTEPAEPAPTTMKSYGSKPAKFVNIME